MGTSPKTRKAALPRLQRGAGVFGEGECVTGAETCQLIEVEPGFPEIFVYGRRRRSATTINVLKIELGRPGHS